MQQLLSSEESNLKSQDVIARSQNSKLNTPAVDGAGQVPVNPVKKHQCNLEVDMEPENARSENTSTETRVENLNCKPKRSNPARNARVGVPHVQDAPPSSIRRQKYRRKAKTLMSYHEPRVDKEGRSRHRRREVSISRSKQSQPEKKTRKVSRQIVSSTVTNSSRSRNRDRKSEPGKRNRTSEPRKRNRTPEPQKRNRTPEPQKRDRTSQSRKRDRTSEPQKRDRTSQPRNRDRTSQPRKRDRTSQPRKRDRTSEPRKRKRTPTENAKNERSRKIRPPSKTTELVFETESESEDNEASYTDIYNEVVSRYHEIRDWLQSDKTESCTELPTRQNDVNNAFSTTEHPPLQLSKVPLIRHNFTKTEAAPIAQVNSLSDLQELLKRNSEFAQSRFNQWAPILSSDWVCEMFLELEEEDREEFMDPVQAFRKGTLNTVRSMLSEWGRYSELGMTIVEKWFEGKGFEEVLARAEKLGHLDMLSGCVLKGKYIEKLNVGKMNDCTLEEVLDNVEKICTRENREVRFFTTSEDANFVANTESVNTQDLRSSVTEAQKTGNGIGSLDTTFNFASGRDSKVQCLDSYFSFLRPRLAQISSHVSMNPLLYLIWKTKGYTTAHHQDFHVPPHFTLYNQMSGHSCFHFLPLLIGLYVAHVATQRSMDELQELLHEIDQRNIGSVAHIESGDFLLIFPFGSHGVWVPTVDGKLKPYDDDIASVIRAVELYSVSVQPEIKSSVGDFRKRFRKHHKVVKRDEASGINN